MAVDGFPSDVTLADGEEALASVTSASVIPGLSFEHTLSLTNGRIVLNSRSRIFGASHTQFPLRSVSSVTFVSNILTKALFIGAMMVLGGIAVMLFSVPPLPSLEDFFSNVITQTVGRSLGLVLGIVGVFRIWNALKASVLIGSSSGLRILYRMNKTDEDKLEEFVGLVNSRLSSTSL